MSYLVGSLGLDVATVISTISFGESVFVWTLSFYFLYKAFSLSYCVYNVITFCIMINLQSTIMQVVFYIYYKN